MPESARRLSVVLIEDEPDLRYFEQVLLALDYDVRAPADFSRRVLLDPTLWVGVDVAIVDLGLPGIDGREILDWLRRTHPDVRRVLVTGTNVDADDPIVRQAHRVLLKPYAAHLLRDAVDEARG